MEQKVLEWYATDLAARNKGKKRATLLNDLKKPSFIKNIRKSLHTDMLRATRKLNLSIQYNEGTAPDEIFSFLKNRFIGEMQPA